MQLMISNAIVRLYNVTSNMAIIWEATIIFTRCSTYFLVCSLVIVRANLLEHCHLIKVWWVTSSIVKLFFCLSTYLTVNTRGKVGKYFRYSVLSSASLRASKNTATTASMKTRMWLTPRGDSQCYIWRLKLRNNFRFFGFTLPGA